MRRTDFRQGAGSASGSTDSARATAGAGGDRGLEFVAWLMDRAFTIPGTRMSVGLDALIGLLPFGGDLLTGLIQVGLVLVALRRYNVPRTVAARMVGNVLLDIGVGSIPLLGDLFDASFKANTRNIRLLDAYRREPVIDVEGRVVGTSPSTSRDTAPPAPGSSRRLIVLVALVLIGTLLLALIGFIAVVRWLLRTI